MELPVNKNNVIRSEETHAAFNTGNLERRLDHELLSETKALARYVAAHSARRTLPYGSWECEDGREVIFNREYQPILQRQNGVNSYADRGEWVKNIKTTTYLYNDATSPINLLLCQLKGSEQRMSDKKACKRSLLIALQVLAKYSPADGLSAGSAYSIARLK